MEKRGNSRVSSSRPRKFWKLDMLAEVVMRELTNMEKPDDLSRLDEMLYDVASKEETLFEEAKARDASIFVNVPRKKRRLPHRMVTTRWTTTTMIEPRNPNLQNDDQESSPSTSSSSCVTESKKRGSIKEEEIRSYKKRRTVDRRLDLLPIPTTIPEWLVNVMSREENAYDPKLIIVKKLYMSDLEKGQGRLSLPFQKLVSSDFLTEEETRIIYEHSVLTTRKEGVSVVLVDPRLNKHKVDLRKWKMNGCYVLVDGWNDVVAKNKFRIDDVFLVWSFRYGGGKLCFALVPPARNSGYTTGESSH